MSKKLYYETSTVNYLSECLPLSEIKKHRAMMRKQGLAPTLSPITLWEILSTSNFYKREELIYVCQFLFDKNIYPSVTELLDIYLKDGCEINQRSNIFVKSDSCIYQSWIDIYRNKNKTIILPEDDFKKYNDVIYTTSKMLNDLLQNKFVEQKHLDETYNLVCQLISETYQCIDFIKEDVELGKLNEKQIIFYKTTLFFLISILIFGMDFCGDKNKEFWDARSISTLIDKTNYLVNNAATLLYRGPLVCMATMALRQVDGRANRGLFKDCMHMAYLPYCTTFFSNDQHFIDVSRSTPEFMFGKILGVRLDK